MPKASPQEAVKATLALETPADAAATQALDVPLLESDSLRSEIAAAAAAAEGDADSEGAVEGVVVLAVDHWTSQPVPHADVFYAHWPQMRAYFEAQPEPKEWNTPAVLTAMGKRATTDATGRLRLPVSDEDWFALVHKGDLWGWREIESDESAPARIEVFANRTLRVQVLDAALRPLAGVPITVLAMQDDDDVNRWKATTRGDDGMAVFEHADMIFYEYYGNSRFVVVPDVLASEQIRLGFEIDPWPVEPLRLHLPPTGSVSVELLDETGSDYGGRFEVEFRVPQPSGRVHTFGKWETRQGTNGVARLERAALGLDLYMTVRVHERQPATHHVRGPTLAGEEVHVRVPLSERRPALIGRLLDQHHKPLVDLGVRVAFTRPRSDGIRSEEIDQFTTDAAGRFRAIMRGVTPRLGPVTDLFLLSFDRAEEAGLEACPTLPPVLVAGDNDLGDVVMVEGRPVLSGRVIDDAGNPISGANVELHSAIDERSGVRTRPLYTAYSRSRGDGTFDVRAPWPATKLVLVVEENGFLPLRSREFAPGTKGIEIVMEPAAILAGKVLCNPGVAVQQLELSMIDIDPQGESSEADTIHPDADGSFEFPAMRTCTSTIVARLAGEELPLATIEGVRAIAGKTERDPRLDPLDLRGLVHAINLKVVSGDDAPITDGWARVLVADPASNPPAQVIVDGRVQLLARTESADIEVWSPGYALAEVAGAQDSQRIVLHRGFPVLLELDPDVPLPPAGTTLFVRLLPCDESGTVRHSTITMRRGSVSLEATPGMPAPIPVVFGPSRVATCFAVSPGPNQVRFTLYRAGDDNSEWDFSCDGREDCRVVHVSSASGEKATRVAPNPILYQKNLNATTKK